ncbi:ubiquinone biosynthesis protein COQ9 [Trichoderma citrinoviride]|uniref:Ubiquinone biosynthesis protein n=1 Tax=Trichoderma citrinoviride TaxID=58853 RepID=A0A2T4AZH7_9HYPO|nr:ubiquinone biosynthesis protein COQ9 [Trichoderma citrinoviride]PTB62474.1 ubiquinone biosynthesis protein COQ9 [Trichoderma citrinoviride]
MASPCVARTARCLSASARRPIARQTAPASSSWRANTTTPTSRAYHSHEHPPSPPFGPVDRAILAAAYRHVPEHGFSLRAIGLGARDAGYPDISASVLPDGQFSLIRYHLVAQRERLADRSRELLSDEAPLSAAGVGEKVAALTWERLMGNKDVIHRWQEALAVMAQPSYLPKSLAELAALSDDIWFLAGDKAVDPSWYTKRAALSMVYSSSELFMTNDRSPSFLETRQFLHRRLGEVQSVGGTIGSVGQWVGFTLSAGVNVLRSKGVPI